jgi:hypothetical protein
VCAAWSRGAPHGRRENVDEPVHRSLPGSTWSTWILEHLSAVAELPTYTGSVGSMLVAQRAAGAAAAALIALATGGVGLVDGVFGLYDSTAEELADLFGVDEAPPAAVAAVRALRPVYEPLKSLSPSCTAALYPEFNDDLDWNDCSLLPRRVFWRSGVRAPLVVQQTMRTDNMWDASTGSVAPRALQPSNNLLLTSAR